MNRLFAQILSYLLHPVIYPLLGLWIITKSLPHHISSQMVIVTLLFVLLGTYIIPLLISFFMYRLGLIKSLEMKRASDRKLPYMVGALCFYLTSNYIKAFPLPSEAYLFLLASALVILIHLLLLGFFKPSAHLAGIGGFIGLLLAISLKYHTGLLIYIALAFILSGFLASARLSLKAHTPFELVFGFTSGLLVAFGIICWV